MKAESRVVGAVLFWASLAPLVLQLSQVPPLLLTATGLLIGSSLALPFSRFHLLDSWRVLPGTILLGVFGLFGYHIALFFALQNAPAAEANLINYLWPAGIVVLTPLLLRGFKLSRRHLVAVPLGFAGAATAILGAHTAPSATSSWANSALGYVAAFAAAVIWATYSVLTKRRPSFDTAAIGLFGLLSGSLALVMHLLLESPYSWQLQDLPWIFALGLGPLGLAFYLWDSAIKLGNPIRIGIISFLTPLLSTIGVLVVQGQQLTASIVVAALLIVSAGAIGAFPSATERDRKTT